MTQKIDISEEAYKKLLELKKTDESFSKLILRMINEKEKINSSKLSMALSILAIFSTTF